MNSLFTGILMSEALNVNAMSTCRKMIPNDWSPFFCCCIYFCSPVSYTTNICVYINTYEYILSRWTFISTTVNYINGWSCMFLFGKHPFTSTKNSKKNWTTTPPWILLQISPEIVPGTRPVFFLYFPMMASSRLESWWSVIRWCFLSLITLSLV